MRDLCTHGICSPSGSTRRALASAAESTPLISGAATAPPATRAVVACVGVAECERDLARQVRGEVNFALRYGAFRKPFFLDLVYTVTLGLTVMS